MLKLKMAPISEKIVKENEVDDVALTRNIWYIWTFDVLLGSTVVLNSQINCKFLQILLFVVDADALYSNLFYDMNSSLILFWNLFQ